MAAALKVKNPPRRRRRQVPPALGHSPADSCPRAACQPRRGLEGSRAAPAAEGARRAAARSRTPGRAGWSRSEPPAPPGPPLSAARRAAPPLRRAGDPATPRLLLLLFLRRLRCGRLRLRELRRGEARAAFSRPQRSGPLREGRPRGCGPRQRRRRPPPHGGRVASAPSAAAARGPRLGERRGRRRAEEGRGGERAGGAGAGTPPGPGEAQGEPGATWARAGRRFPPTLRRRRAEASAARVPLLPPQRDGCQLRAHLHRHQARWGPARAGGRDHQAVRAEGLPDGGHEVRARKSRQPGSRPPRPAPAPSS